MNERPNRRREERGSRVRDERSQNRPADYGDRPRRSSQKHKGGKVLYYGVLAILLGVLVFSSVKIISYMMEKKESEKSQQDLIDQVVTPVTPSNDNTDGNTDSNTHGNPNGYAKLLSRNALIGARKHSADAVQRLREQRGKTHAARN